MDKNQKSLISLRYWLQGASYSKASAALELMLSIQKEIRKDGVTPEYIHPIRVTNFARTLYGNLLYPEDTMIALLLHDVPEDYDFSFDELEKKFGSRAVNAIRLLTKKYRGARTPDEQYFKSMIHDPIASIGKACDRIDNQGDMINVFTLSGQEHYVNETEQFIIPMLKEARREHPEQEPAYENLKYVLKSQIGLIRAIRRAESGEKQYSTPKTKKTD